MPDVKPGAAARGAGEWGRIALGVLAVGFTFNLLGRGTGETYTVFLLPLEREFGWSRSQLTSVYALYLLVGGLIAPLVGSLFDRLGPRVVYSVGLSVLAAAYLFASTITALWQFYVYVGLLVGVGVALVGMVPTSVLLGRWYRVKLSTAIGIAFSAMGCGVLLFVPLAQILVAQYDWRIAYRVLGGLLLTIALLAVFFIPWQRIAAGRPEYERHHGVHAAGDGWTLHAAIRTRAYWGLAAMFFLTAAGMFTVTPQTVAYLIDRGYTPIAAATAYGAVGMLSVVGTAATGLVTERFGNRATTTASYLGSALGIIVLLAISFYAAGALVILYVLVFGLCQGVRGPIISAICATRFAGPRVATIYGTIYAMNALGAACGSLMGGVLHDVTDGYRAGLVVGLAGIALAALPFWLVREMREFR